MFQETIWVGAIVSVVAFILLRIYMHKRQKAKDKYREETYAKPKIRRR